MVLLDEEINEDAFTDFVAAMEEESQQKFNSYSGSSFESFLFGGDGLI